MGGVLGSIFFFFDVSIACRAIYGRVAQGWILESFDGIAYWG
jgi:hypothetical protein